MNLGFLFKMHLSHSIPIFEDAIGCINIASVFYFVAKMFKQKENYFEETYLFNISRCL